jgi:hypothetical protein
MADVTLHFAKVAVASQGLNTGGQTRQDFEEAIAKRAEAAFPDPGLSKAQKFTRYMVETREGDLLYKASRLAPPRQAPQDLVATVDRPEPKGPAAVALDKLVEEFSARYNRSTSGRKLSRQQAYARVIDDPKNRRLRDAVRREEMEQTLRVAQLRAPIWRAEEEFEADFRLGESKGSRRL